MVRRSNVSLSAMRQEARTWNCVKNRQSIYCQALIRLKNRIVLCRGLSDDQGEHLISEQFCHEDVDKAR